MAKVGDFGGIGQELDRGACNSTLNSSTQLIPPQTTNQHVRLSYSFFLSSLSFLDFFDFFLSFQKKKTQNAVWN